MILRTTASAHIGSSNMATQGYSETALYVAEQAEQGCRHLQNSSWSGSKEIFSELWELSEECRTENWDGYGATPISTETFKQTYFFLKALPLGTAWPSLGAEPDGHITLEWHHSLRHTLSVSVSPEGELHYAALLGLRKAYGTEIFLGEIPRPILDLIHQVTDG